MRRHLTDPPATVNPPSPSLLASLATAGAFLAGAALFIKSYFLVNDDVFILQILKGYGISLAPDPHVFFSHFLFTQPLCWLYQWFPNGPWYPASLVLIQWLSLSAVLHALRMIAPDRRLTLVLGTSFFIAEGLYLIQNLNLTLTSALAFQGGLVLWMALLTGTRTPAGKGVWSLGGLCLLLSILLRPETIPLFALAALPLFLMAFRFPGARRRALALVVAVAAVWGACSWAQRSYYSRDPGWDSYRLTYPLNRQAHDFRSIEYETNQGFFDHLGWSHNDFLLFYGWYYWDADRFSRAQFQAILDHFPAPRPAAVAFKGLLDSLSNRAAVGLLICFALFTAFFLDPRGRRWALAGLAWEALLLLSLSIYYKVPERIVLPLCSFTILGVFHLASPRPFAANTLRGSKTGQLLGIACLVFSLSFVIFSAHRADQKKRFFSQLLEKTTKDLNPQPDQLFIAWDSVYPFEDLGAFDDLTSYRNFHIFSFTAYQCSPIGKEMLDHFGMSNPLRDALDNPSVFLICNPYEAHMGMTYLQERYGIQAGFQTAFSSYPFTAYRLVSRPLTQAARP